MEILFIDFISSRMNLKLGFTFFLLLLLVDLPGILSRKCHKGGHKCKVHENSPIPVDLPRLCGDNIIDVYKNICHTVWVRRRRRRGKYMRQWFIICLVPYLRDSVTFRERCSPKIFGTEENSSRRCTVSSSVA